MPGGAVHGTVLRPRAAGPHRHRASRPACGHARPETRSSPERGRCRPRAVVAADQHRPVEDRVVEHLGPAGAVRDLEHLGGRGLAVDGEQPGPRLVLGARSRRTPSAPTCASRATWAERLGVGQQGGLAAVALVGLAAASAVTGRFARPDISSITARACPATNRWSARCGAPRGSGRREPSRSTSAVSRLPPYVRVLTRQHQVDLRGCRGHVPSARHRRGPDAGGSGPARRP